MDFDASLGGADDSDPAAHDRRRAARGRVVRRPDQTVDVLVLGAGPTGLTLAIALRRQGLSPLVIDADPWIAHTSRAVVIHAKTLEVLEPLGVTDELLRRGLRAPVFRARDRNRVRLEIDFRGLATPYNFTLMCPQDQTEAVLRARLADLGGEVFRGVAATGVSVDDDGATVELQVGTTRSRVRARFVVAADGGHSLVRKAAGIKFEGDAYPLSLTLADVRMSWPLDRDEVTLFFSEAGFMVVAPAPDDLFRIVAAVDQAPEYPSIPFVQGLLDRRGPKTSPGRVREIVWGGASPCAPQGGSDVQKGAGDSGGRRRARAQPPPAARA